MGSTPYSALTGFRCVGCGRLYEARGPVYTCETCGPIGGTLDAEYDLASLAGVFTPALLRDRERETFPRYHELLPVPAREALPPVPVVPTPLYRLGGAALPAALSRLRLWVKDDTRHPSGSAKDRASAVAVACARAGSGGIAAASTGNAASSLALFAASAGLPCRIFVPATAPPAKLAQIQAHGADLFAVEGTYDEAFDLCMEACRALGLYNRNTAVNPVLGEGKKTASLEIWEQLGFRAPDAVLVPAGDGCILGGVYKGFRDLRDLGLIGALPVLIGVQAEGSSALAEAWRKGSDRCTPVEAHTVADSLSVSVPRDQMKALRAVRESGGGFVTVSDREILESMSVLASMAGILVEPAAAAPFAGIGAAVAAGLLAPDAEAVLLHTGHGLKDIDAARRAAGWNRPMRIRPRIEDVLEALDERASEKKRRPDHE